MGGWDSDVVNAIKSADIILTNNLVMGQCGPHGAASVNGKIAALLHMHLREDACVICTTAVDHSDSQVQTRGNRVQIPGSVYVHKQFTFPCESFDWKTGEIQGYVCARRSMLA